MNKLKIKHLKPSDFAIMVTNIPRNKNEKQIKYFFENELFNGKDIRVSNISFGYKIKIYHDLTN